MNFANITLFITKFEFHEEGCFQLSFPLKQVTEVADKSTSPKFKSNKFTVCSQIIDGKAHFQYTLKDHHSGREVSKTISLDVDHDATFTHEFNRSKNDNFDGSITFEYQSVKISTTDLVKSVPDIGYLLSINAGYINLLVERPFDIKIQVLTYQQHSLSTLLLSNAHNYSLLQLKESDITHGIVLRIHDTVHNDDFINVIHGGESSVCYFAMQTGETLVFTIQLIQCKMDTEPSLFSMFHTSVMREAAMSLSPDGHKPSIHLTPRRKSVLLASPNNFNPGSMLSSSSSNTPANARESVLAGNLKQILHLIDSSHTLKPESILKNIHPIYSQNLKSPNRTSFHKKFSYSTLEASGGVYIFSTSKSEIIENEQAKIKKKTRRKEVQNLNIGLLPVPKTYLTNPYRVNANLIHMEFTDANHQLAPLQTGDASSQESNGSPHKQSHDSGYSAKVVYTGVLSESSREIFADSGIISCTLEGTLYSSNFLEQKDKIAAGTTSETMQCMTFKVYVSLIPEGSHEIESSHATDEEDDDVEEEETVDNLVEKNLKQMQDDQNAAADKENSKDVELMKMNGEIFNVVDEASASIEELPGSSMLAVPLEKQLISLPSNHPTPEKGSETPKFNIDEKFPKVSSLQLITSKSSQELQSVSECIQFGENMNLDEILEQNALKLPKKNANSKPNNAAAFAEVIKNELLEKTKLIEKLMDEVRERHNAIQVCGKDIRQLREENMNLKKIIAALESAIEQQKLDEQTAAELIESRLNINDPLHTLSPSVLSKSLIKMNTNFEKLLKDKLSLQGRLESRETEIIQLKDVQSKFDTLEDAHLKQNKYLQSIQNEVRKIEAYRTTIQTQEKVIHKLQSVMESKLKSKFSFLKEPSLAVNDSLNKSTDKVTYEMDKMSNQLHHANDEISQLRQKLRLAEEKMKEVQNLSNREPPVVQSPVITNVDPDDDDGETLEEESNVNGQKPSSLKNVKRANMKIDKLMAENISKTFRIEALERQLESSSRESAREIARLRTKLFELEIGLTIGKDDYMDGTDEDDVEIDDAILSRHISSNVLPPTVPDNQNESPVPYNLSIPNISSKSSLKSLKLNTDDSSLIDKVPTPPGSENIFANSSSPEKFQLQES